VQKDENDFPNKKGRDKRNFSNAFFSKLRRNINLKTINAFHKLIILDKLKTIMIFKCYKRYLFKNSDMLILSFLSLHV